MTIPPVLGLKTTRVFTFLLKEQNYAAVCDEHFTKEYEVYANEMELLENYKIDGTPLIELINELENIDSV